jgi:hypothetical protein
VISSQNIRVIIVKCSPEASTTRTTTGQKFTIFLATNAADGTTKDLIT